MTTTQISSDTRTRILSAAWSRVRVGGVAAVTVKDVAADAGVSRQLVYFHYRNRAGLLTAMVREHDRTSGFDRTLAEAGALPPVEGFEAVLRAWLRFLPELLPVARALEAAAITGDVGGEAWQDRMAALRAVCREAVQRLEVAGRLRPGWTVREATDWTWSRVHPATYAHLVGDRSWPSEDFGERTVRSLIGDLVVP